MIRITNDGRRFLTAACVAVSVLLGGCSTSGELRSSAKPQSVDALVRNGLDALEAGRVEAASKAFNRALSRDPKNSYYQLLNALTYHVMAVTGDPTRNELARVGYELALEFDSSNWLASQQLARLCMEEGLYDRALLHFRDALYTNPDDAALLYDAARAAYFAQEFKFARDSIDRALQALPANPEYVGAASMIYAAIGDESAAVQRRNQFSELEASPQRIQRLDSRLGQWKRAHLVADQGHASTAAASAARNSATQQAQPPLEDPKYHWGDPKELSDHDRMVMVDVMILRSEDVEITNKGINLLDGLVAQFSLNFDDRRNQSNAGRYSRDHTIARKLGLSEVRYNLNIFNSGNNRNEVLARPSLVVTDGETSEFFSGQTLNAAVAGRDAGHLEKIDAGVSMKVKPQFRPNGFIKLDIHASRSFFEIGPSGTFNESIRTSKNEITVSVLLRFNQTLILGGLREKEDAEVKDGVPLLRDLPIVQYAFSNEITQDYSESLIILVTPRPLIQGVTTDHQHPGEVHDFAQEFQRDYGQLFDSTPNIGYAAKDLKRHRAYRELYETDIFERPWWGEREDIARILGRTKAYLYY